MNPSARIIHMLMLVKPNEQRATAAAFAMVFILMASYFVLRPVRDAMASDWSDAEVSLLWNIQFFLSIGLVSLYSVAISKLPFRWVVPAVYGAFALSFTLFHVFKPLVKDAVLLEKAFYLWVTAFSLFNVSVFWSFMADTFNPEQGRRIFACIGAGASAGAIVGPAIPALLTSTIGLDHLMLIAAIGLLSVVPIVMYLQNQKMTALSNADLEYEASREYISGHWWNGFRDTFANPYLLGIAIFILLYVFIGSFIYFEQKNLLAEFTRVERTRILGSIDWLINTLTLIIALLFTGRLVGRIGMPLTLALVPLLIIVGLLLLAFAPVITLLLAVKVVRSVGNYAVTRPAREMLFSRVSVEERFKAKPVIDVVVYRGGDAVSGTLFALLTDGVGFGMAVVSMVGAGIASVWAATGFFLGRRYQSIDESRAHDPSLNSTSHHSSSTQLAN